MSSTERKRKFLIDLLFAATIIAIAYVTVKYLMAWLLPFVIGLVVAICLQRPVAFLAEKTKISRGVWSCILVFLVLLILFGLIALILWWIVSETENIIPWITSKVPAIKGTFDNISTWVSNTSKHITVDASGILSSAPAKIIDVAVGAFTGFMTTAASKIITDGPGLLISCIFSVVASCYITKDYRKITNFVLSQLSDKKKELVISIKRLFVTNILFMLRGYIIIMTITFTELLIGLSILGVNHVTVLAALIAILDILPVLGTGTALIPWGIISLLMGNISMGVGILCLYLAITIIRNIIEPKIIGDQVGLPPLVTLISMYLGLQIFGVVGMLIFPVATIILVKLQETGIIHLWKTSECKGEAEQNKPGFFKRIFMKADKNKEKAVKAEKK